MRTLAQIIDDAKSGNKPTHDECYWAMLALSALHYFAESDLRRAADRDNRSELFTARFYLSESTKRSHIAFNKSPQDWVGWSNDPSNPDYQKTRQAALSLLAHVTKDK